MKELTQLESAVDQVLNLDSAAQGNQANRDVLKFLVAQVNRLHAAIVITTSAARAAGGTEPAGDVREFLTRECHYSGREAARLVAVAERLTTTLPNTLAALAGGHITWAHATTVARAEKTLGQAHVSDHEQAWIRNLANQAGPERLQRMVRALADERGIGRAARATARPHGPDQPSFPEPAATTTEPSASDSKPEFDSDPKDVVASQGIHLRSVADDATEPGRSETANLSSTPLASATTPDMTDTHVTTARCVQPGCTNEAKHHRLACTIRLLPAVNATMTVGMLVCETHLAGVEPQVIAAELDVAISDPAGIAA
ncbi:DUF222 domain-containing protein [Kutzneria sp. NPDC052558]|uniref:DUF222 domain-containing protein n=1 Tax=Kutzneria sp. NPDC052558 TaxID=3364121 RepID=UPI0037C7E6A0